MKAKSVLLACLLFGSVAAPVCSTVIPVSSKGNAFAAFDATTQGTLLTSSSVAGQGMTFAGIVNLAVYQNTLGTLDFYYQFKRTGAGTIASQDVETVTGGSFTGYLVDAFFSDADPDGAGIFAAGTNVGDPATAQRNASGSVVGIDFASSNPVANTEISSTYIFRTDAKNYALGTFGVIDGSTISGQAFEPASPVPEAATWAMMLVGFGGMGMAMRNRRARHGIGGLPIQFGPRA